ncbi:MAG: hypothetical protein AMXMBFR46_07340 [Acidimicrobiia bacterium]
MAPPTRLDMLPPVFAEGAWAASVDGVWPPRLRVGRGSAGVVAGWIFHRRSPIVSLGVAVGRTVSPVTAHSMPRADVFDSLHQDGDEPSTATYTSGFWAVVGLPGVEHDGETACALVARTQAGDEWRVDLPPLDRAPEPSLPGTRRDPRRVSICMATYDPDVELFERQIESIRAQSHSHWHCVITDDGSRPEVLDAMRRVIGGDPRFALHPEPRRLGPYFNFERALARASPDAGLVALADQDDEWYPDKLTRLVAALGTGHVLAYSDQRLTTRDRRVLSETFWVDRRNQWHDLQCLLLSNTVTGAATLLRRELLDRALPFPPRLPAMHHDHWIALVARVQGTLTYVDEPLYDYVQHAGQVVGHAAAASRPRVEPRDELHPSWERALLLRWQRHYFEHLLPMQLMATALLERFGDETRPSDRDVLRRAAAGDGSRAGLCALARTVPARRHGPMLGYGRDALLGALWRRVVPIRAARGDRPHVDGRHSVHMASLAVDYGPGTPDTGTPDTGTPDTGTPVSDPARGTAPECP